MADERTQERNVSPVFFSFFFFFFSKEPMPVFPVRSENDGKDIRDTFRSIRLRRTTRAVEKKKVNNDTTDKAF